MILNCGFSSILRVIFDFRFTLPMDLFPNIDRIKNIECPVCILHSIKDEIVPFEHAKDLYKNAKNPYIPLYIDGTNHNNIDRIAEVYNHINKFLKYLDADYTMNLSTEIIFN